MPNATDQSVSFFGKCFTILSYAKISDRKGWNDRMATIGQQIRAARKAKGMTLSALAALVNMSRQGVSHWEQGRTLPDAQMLLQLSRILGYNFEANMTHEEPQERSETGCQCRFTLSASHEGTFPFYPEKLVAQLHYRLPQDEGIPRSLLPRFPSTTPKR